MTQTNEPRDSLALAIVGSGGAGAMTAGGILIEAAGKCGLYGLMTRSVGPQIRGGEAAALLRLSMRPVACMSGAFDLLVAIDWKNVGRFADELPLDADSLIIADPAAGDIPPEISAANSEVTHIPIRELASEIPGGRENMIATGLAAAFAGIPETVLIGIIESKLATKGADAIKASCACLREGMRHAASLDSRRLTVGAANERGSRWLITGNEAAGLGAIRGGIRFSAAYPITPATEVLEWLAPALAKTGGALVQAEDELASANMAIGASFGGRPALTATSGPGLALMMESIGLAAASETPIVVIDVMRCGPSTGIATKSEQSDLNIAVQGLHGDAPHVVVAPLSPTDCLMTTQWAVHLAEAMQVPAIVLSDQSIGQARVLADKPAEVAFMTKRSILTETPNEVYKRYAITADGVSPMAIPGMPGGQYTADGLTHGESGRPSTSRIDHERHMDKRRRKVEDFDYGDHWGEVEGEGETAILTWGSMAGPAREAVHRLRADGITVRRIGVRLLAPFPAIALGEALAGVKNLLIVEQNHSGQFHHYLRANMDLSARMRAFNRPGPLSISPDEIVNEIKGWATS
ncbi:MAG: 2-oxoacid:acceptor oxidoreductase subunit alpha [Paracoccaceae bacterium]